ncbi:MAG: hypothetical protein N2C12_11095, partial [Planctomycetales bacterium]
QSRLNKIEAMLEDEPDDAFLRYSRAMELDKLERHDESLEEFTRLTREVPPLVSAFFMAGQQLARLGRIEEARGLLQTGVDEARQQGEMHAAGEMSEFLDSLGALGP